MTVGTTGRVIEIAYAPGVVGGFGPADGAQDLRLPNRAAAPLFLLQLSLFEAMIPSMSRSVVLRTN